MTTRHRTLGMLLVAFGAASFVHFMHNAEFIADYPKLPAAWTRADVYIAWLSMTAIGLFGWSLLARGREIAGALVIAVYAILGLDSLGHYFVAPLSSHTLAMNATILLEVTTAALVLIEAVRRIGPARH